MGIIDFSTFFTGPTTTTIIYIIIMVISYGESSLTERMNGIDEFFDQ